MYHYVYILEEQETGEFYIGSRTCECLPEQDNYLGSMSVWKPEKDLLIKTIIKSDFETRDKAIEFESELIQEYINDELNRNYHIPSKSYHTRGLVPVKDSEGNCFLISKDDPRYLRGELQHNCKGQITVKDFNNNVFIILKDDPRYLKGELVGITKGMVNVKDSGGNCFQVSKDDERYLSGELVGVTKGHKHSEVTKQKLRKSKNKGKNNPQYGTCWIYNLDLKESKRIEKNNLDLWLNQGWVKGRKLKF